VIAGWFATLAALAAIPLGLAAWYACGIGVATLAYFGSAILVDRALWARYRRMVRRIAALRVAP
jgi:hypothetical protein